MLQIEKKTKVCQSQTEITAHVLHMMTYVGRHSGHGDAGHDLVRLLAAHVVNGLKHAAAVEHLATLREGHLEKIKFRFTLSACLRVWKVILSRKDKERELCHYKQVNIEQW